MTHVAAIYGFEFTREFTAAGLQFSPITTDHQAAKRLARDLRSHHLTGTVFGEKVDRELIYELEGVLSFIEHLDVMILFPANESEDNQYPTDLFEPTITTHKRNNGGGAVIGSDAFNRWKESRQQFIELALSHLRDKEFCERTKFRSLLFKCVETFRQRQPFLEITYFLLISGLEAFCRASQSDYKSSNAAIPITRQLKAYGFNVFQDKPSDLSRSISTYLHIRNALFHQGEFITTVNINNGKVELNCSKHLFNLSMLCSLTVMKAIGFDDGRTNWDCWIDRQLFK
jgi:hypothetical protein